LVGGAVRDKILGIPVQDKDWLVIGATPDEMQSQGFTQVGKDFPVFLHPETKEEYALARTERKIGKGYVGFETSFDPTVTVEEDLARRDITINAMAMDENENMIDPYGGQEDIKQKQLRHVTTAFVEDPLRVLRVCRFSARYNYLSFKINDETLSLMRTIVESRELETLAVERVWMETKKALMERTPSIYFESLRSCGALSELFPEVYRLFGVEQRKEFHPEIDAGIHTMMTIDKAAELHACAEVRFACLVHDLGKADTPKDVLPKHIGHEVLSVKRVNQLCKRLMVPNSYSQLAIYVAKYHTQCHQALTLRPATIVKLFESLDAYRKKDNLTNFLLACKADGLGRKGFGSSDYQQYGYLLRLFEKTKEVDPKPIVESGFKGDEIREAIRRKRIQIVAMEKNAIANDLSS